VPAGGSPAEAARGATDRVPIVALNAPDLVAMGWAATYARPAGNITGIRTFTQGTAIGARHVDVEICGRIPRPRVGIAFRRC
jgi:hypothetical protein